MDLKQRTSDKQRVNFECNSCHLQMLVDAFDRKLGNAPNQRVIFMEEVFLMKAENSAVCVGGVCSLCKGSFCTKCSIFYMKRFCKTCVQNNLSAFPFEIRKEFKKE